MRRRHCFDERRLVVGVFHDGHSRQDVAAAEHFVGHAVDDLLEAEVLDCAMVDFCPVAVSQSDQKHLHQPAFDGAGEARVWLHAVAHHHVIGLEGQAIEVDGKAFGGSAHHDRFHARSDGAADGFFGNAIRLDELPLSFGRAAAVAAHRRHDERLRAEAIQMIDRSGENDRDIGDAAASGRNRHRLAGQQLLAQVEPGKLRLNLAPHVDDAGGVECLPKAEDFWKRGHRKNPRRDHAVYAGRNPDKRHPITPRCSVSSATLGHGDCKGKMACGSSVAR